MPNISHQQWVNRLFLQPLFRSVMQLYSQRVFIFYNMIKQRSKYIFRWAQTQKQNKPDTLIILKMPEEVIRNIYNIAYPKFIWLNDRAGIPKDVQVELETKSNLQIHYFDNVNEASTFAKKYPNNFIICSKSLLQSALRNLIFLSVNKTVICFPCSQEIDQQIEQNLKVIKVNDLGILFEQIEQMNSRTQSFKLLPNFVTELTEAHELGMIQSTIKWMIEQKITIRNLIIPEFEKLVDLLKFQTKKDEKDKEKFIKLIKQKKSLTSNQALKCYTEDTFLYKLVNNIMRSCRHPGQICYLQPFFKDLFNAVNLIGKDQASEKQLQNFTCFRGGKMSIDEIRKLQQNVGYSAKNLNFLSASLSKEVALKWAEDVLFVIQVNNQSNTPYLNINFAFIRNYSEFYGEQEILFNPLCCFSVKEVSEKWEEGKYYYEIKLQYKLSSQQIISQKPINICMGDIKNKTLNYFDGQLEYWQEYLGLATSPNKRVKGLIQIGQTFLHLQKNREALKNIEQAIKISDSNKCISSLSIKLIYGTALRLNGKFKDAVCIHKQIVETQRSKDDYSDYVFNVLTQLFHDYITLGENEKAFQVVEQIIEQVPTQKRNIFEFYQILQIIANIFESPHIQEALKIYADQIAKLTLLKFGQSSIYYVLALNRQGDAHSNYSAQQDDIAMKLYKQALKIALKIQGSELQVCQILNNIAFICTNRGNHHQALVYLQQAIYFYSQYDTKHSISYIKLLQTKWIILINMKDIKLATAVSKQVVTLCYQFYGNTHLKFIGAICNFAQSLMLEKKYYFARGILLDMIPIIQNIEVENTFLQNQFLKLLKISQQNCSNYQNFFQEIEDIKQDSKEYTLADILKLPKLAQALQQMQCYQDAIDFYLIAKTRLMRDYGHLKKSILSVFKDLIFIFAKLKDYYSLLQFYQELLFFSETVPQINSDLLRVYLQKSLTAIIHKIHYEETDVDQDTLNRYNQFLIKVSRPAETISYLQF